MEYFNLVECNPYLFSDRAIFPPPSVGRYSLAANNRQCRPPARPPTYRETKNERPIFRTTLKVWIDRTIEGTGETTAAGLLDECVLDDDEGKCGRFESALAKLDSLLGLSAGEQY